MPLDPSIILGAKPAQIDFSQFSPVNTLMTSMKLNQLDQEGQLNALTLKERKDLQTFLAENPDLTKPETRYKLATQFGESGRKLSTGVTEIGKAATEESKRRNELVVSKTNLYRDALRDVTDQRDALKWLQTQQQDPDMAGSPVTKVSIMDAARSIPADPAGFADWKNKAALGLSEYIKQNKPVTFAQDLGPTGRVLSRPGLGGEATVVPGSEYTKGKTFADLTAERQASTSAGQLGLAQAKFKFEQANPTMSIQEDPSGLLAVNTRTGVATPVVYGPMGIQAAPAAAPTAAPVAGPSVMRQQGAGMPGERVSAIPGMTSVLDRNVAPAAMPMPAESNVRVAGQPVGSKKEAPVKFNDTDLQLAGLAGSLKDFKDEVGKNLFTGAKFVPSGADTAAMTSKYTALLMGVKDLYTLGALTGPDMSIIESQITNPASWSGKFTTKKGFEEQTKVIEDMLKRSTTNLETTYGRVPKASKKAIETMSSGGTGNNAIPNATATNPLGLTLPGVR
jgi:hypothetical protein